MADMALEGMDNILKKLEEMGRKGAAIQNKALKSAAELIQRSASNKADRSSNPNKSGRKGSRTGQHMADNIEIGKVKTKGGTKFIKVGFEKGDNSPYYYAKFEEWGTSKRAAHPFMQPAFEENKENIKEIITDELKKGLGL